MIKLKSTWNENGLAFIRVLTGLLMIYHGIEIFNPEIINMYLGWEAIKALPFPVVLTYTGKSIELITGICFVLGLFTRTAALLMAFNMSFICFYVGSGKFYYDDQHPFLFVLLALVFFFTGAVKFGLDKKFFKDQSLLINND